MPSSIKFLLSIIVLCVGVGLHYWEIQQGEPELSWFVILLAIFMVLAMWIFPETGDKNKQRIESNDV